MSNHVEIKAEISVLHILPCILPRLDSKKNKIKWCRARRTCSYSKVGFIEVTYNIHVGIRLDVRACSSLALIVNHIYTFSPHGWVLREPKTRKEKKRKKKKKKALRKTRFEEIEKNKCHTLSRIWPPVIQRQVGEGLTLRANRTGRAIRISAPNPSGSWPRPISGLS